MSKEYRLDRQHGKDVPPEQKPDESVGPDDVMAPPTSEQIMMGIGVPPELGPNDVMAPPTPEPSGKFPIIPVSDKIIVAPSADDDLPLDDGFNDSPLYEAVLELVRAACVGDKPRSAAVQRVSAAVALHQKKSESSLRKNSSELFANLPSHCCFVIEYLVHKFLGKDTSDLEVGPTQQHDASAFAEKLAAELEQLAQEFQRDLQEDSGENEHDVAEKTEILEDWRSSPSELLAKLQNGSISRAELFDAVLFAEVVKFNDSQTGQLVTRLLAFVNDYRLTQDDDAKTAVGAAIRKLAMNLQDSQIEEYADLLLPTDTDTLPCEIELELAKAILWRLTSLPSSLSQEYSKLEDRLAELALDYLKPRLILQKNYASVALQAILGVLVLDRKKSASMLKCVKDLEIGWFTDLVMRRIMRLRKQFEEKGDTTSPAIATSLKKFELDLQQG